LTREWKAKEGVLVPREVPDATIAGYETLSIPSCIREDASGFEVAFELNVELRTWSGR
jgi:hypothetical protein